MAAESKMFAEEFEDSRPAEEPEVLPKSGGLSAPIKYPGGKSWLVSKVTPIYSQYRDRRWNDRFCGACSLPFALQPERAVLNDLNGALVNFLQWLQRGGVRKLGFLNNEETYLELRSAFNERKGDPQWSDWCAEVLFILNRFAYNGLYRSNSKGEFNAPYGYYEDGKVYIPDLTKYAPVMQNWELYQGHFTGAPLDPSDVVVLDPPYDGGFTEYCGAKFTWLDQVELARWIVSVHSGPIIACNRATDRIIRLYRDELGFDVELIHAPRSISCTGDRTPALEMFATRNL